MMLNDNCELVRVIVEEGCEVSGVMYVVSEVWEEGDDVSVGVSYVNGEDMMEYMSKYNEDWFKGEVIDNSDV
jgi:hypothetical protein